MPGSVSLRPVRRLGSGAFGTLVAGLIAIGLAGCASMPSLPGMGGGSGERARKIPLRVERPEAPADYDVLVGEIAQSEGDYALARVAFERAAGKDPDSAYIHERLARLAWQLDDVEGAVLEAEQAFALAPDSIRVRLFLGRLYRLRRDFDGLNRVLRDEYGRPLDADSAFALFQVALERRDFEDAEALAGDLDALEPDQLRGKLALATVYEQKGDYAGAESIVRQALESFPDHFLLYMRLADLKRSAGDRAGEIAIYSEVLDKHPRHYGILQRLGQTQIEGDDLEGAIETYRKIAAYYPEDLRSLRRLASLEFAAGRYEQAEARLEEALARDPSQADFALDLGQVRRAAGDEAGAFEAFERVPPSHPSYATARVQISYLLEAQGDPGQALAEIERLRTMRPDRQLDYRAAELRIANGDFEGGIALLEGMLDGSEDDLDIYYQLGAQYGAHGDVDEALEYMQRVLESDPNNANALNYIGYSWAERGENLEQAEQLIRRALEISPEDGYITDSLGWVYYKMAESLMAQSRKDEAFALLDQAHKTLIRAAELTGGDSVVSEHLGDVFLLRGKNAKALDYYEEAVGLEVRESEQPKLLEKLDRLRRDLGRDVSSSEAP